MKNFIIKEIIDAGLYTKDDEKIMDLTDACIQHLLGKIVINKKDNSEEKS